MIKQNYYRLDELDREFGLNIGKLRYLIENSGLRLLFNKPVGKCLIGSLDTNRAFIGYGVAKYSGYITLRKKQQLELLTKSKVNASTIFILEKEKVQILSNTYPYQLPVPNSYVKNWQKKSDITNIESLWALPYLSETDGLMRRIFSLLTDMDDNVSGEVKETISKLPEKTLSANPMSFDLDDICVTRLALIKLGIIEDKQRIKSITAKCSRTENAFKRLVQNLIKLYPQKGAVALWNCLHEQHESDETLDPESILAEVGRDELTWIDSKNIERTITKKTFRNMVSEERNK